MFVTTSGHADAIVTVTVIPYFHACNEFEKNGKNEEPKGLRMRFFAYNWKLAADSGAFLLTLDNFSLSTYSWSFSPTFLVFLLTIGAFLLTVGTCV